MLRKHRLPPIFSSAIFTHPPPPTSSLPSFSPSISVHERHYAPATAAASSFIEGGPANMDSALEDFDPLFTRESTRNMPPLSLNDAYPRLNSSYVRLDNIRKSMFYFFFFFFFFLYFESSREEIWVARLLI